MTSPHLDDEQIADLVDNRSTPANNGLHLEGCSICREQYDQQKKVKTLVAEPVPSRSAADVEAAIAAALKPSNVVAYDPTRRRKQRRLDRYRVASIAAVGLIGAGLFLTQLQDDDQKTNTAATARSLDQQDEKSSSASGEAFDNRQFDQNASGAASPVSPQTPAEVASLRSSARPDALDDPCAKVVARAPVSFEPVEGVGLMYQGNESIAFYNSTDRIVVVSRRECDVLLDAIVAQ